MYTQLIRSERHDDPQRQPIELRRHNAPSQDDKRLLKQDTKHPPVHKGRFVQRLVIGLAGVVITGMAIWYGWHYWTVGRFQESTDDAYIRADSTILAPKVSGLLASVRVGDNEPVKAGRPLAKIDDRDYRTALKQAEANVVAAKAGVDNLRASIDQQRALIEQARATVALDQANLIFAGQQDQRYSVLASKGAGSVQNAQQATSRLDAARATLRRDQASATAAERQVGMFEAQLARARAELQHDLAAEEQAGLNLSYTTIVAPIDGVVGNRTLRVGQYVQAGTALMGLVPLNAVYVVANFKETQLVGVKRGQPVEIEVDSFPGRIVRGAVDTIAPASGQEFALLPPDNATGNFTKIVQRVPVRIVLDPKDRLIGQLRPGMSVVPTIDLRNDGGKP